MDADLAVLPGEITAFLPHMWGTCDVIIGSRRSSDSCIDVPQNILRQTLGRSFTLLANAILGLNCSDVTCAFKCFSAHAARIIFSRSKIDRWAYDAEILYMAKQSGLRVHEVGVHWSNGRDTRVRLIRDMFGSLWDLLRIRILHRNTPYGS
jgi:hypothetical protein